MHELVLRVPEALVEAVSDTLIDELEALSVSMTDADAGTAAESPLFGEPGLPTPGTGWEHSEISALFADEAAATAAAALLLAHDWGASLQAKALRPVADRDWVRLTQAQFAPVPITPEFWIVPSWHEAPAQARSVIRLDPGLAFGTGTHPTTRMCLRWIACHAGEPDPVVRGSRVLDYGCGSGILAIAAALHGATSIDAVDVDPAAVEATRANAHVNRVALRAGTPELVAGSYALVLANILAQPLKLLAPLLSAHVAPGGHLLLAGILERQCAELATAYAPGLELRVADTEEGWVLMTARRPG